MPLTYVIPDLHGRADLLEEAFARIVAHAFGRGGTIVTLGDYANKGPNSRGVIERLLQGPPEGFALVALKGNHDAMMADALHDPAQMTAWMEKGGRAALASYDGEIAAIPQEHADWLDSLPLLHGDAHRLYVHAGLDPMLPLAAQSERVLLTKRYVKGETGGYGARHVVHGHDNQVDGPLLVEGRSNLDTCAWRTGRLTIGVFDDDAPGGPIELITVQGSAVG